MSYIDATAHYTKGKYAGAGLLCNALKKGHDLLISE